MAFSIHTGFCYRKLLELFKVLRICSEQKFAFCATMKRGKKLKTLYKLLTKFLASKAKLFLFIYLRNIILLSSHYTIGALSRVLYLFFNFDYEFSHSFISLTHNMKLIGSNLNISLPAMNHKIFISPFKLFFFFFCRKAEKTCSRQSSLVKPRVVAKLLRMRCRWLRFSQALEIRDCFT